MSPVLSNPVFTHPACLDYAAQGHPESPERVSRTVSRLALGGHNLLRPEPAREEWVLRVHEPAHWAAVQAGTFLDPDTPAYPGIAEIALLAAGGAVAAMESAADGTPAFSLMRPPGHHAGRRRVAGFCFLNNIAIAVQKALDDRKAERVAIVDVDVHHGDGTEDIARGREGWLFLSIHQSPLYPGTGLVSEGNCLNYPVPPGTDGEGYLKVLGQVLDEVKRFNPDLLAVSAGFDTFRDCPIANLALVERDYQGIGSALSTFPRRFAVLEGGYAPELPALIDNFLQGFF